MSSNSKRHGIKDPKYKNQQPVKIIPLGGIGEIGKNMTAFEYGNDIIIVDCGMSFPEENMPGVDCVIPDFTYIRRNQEKLRGILITHGHEDHIGSLPYFLREFKCPVFGGTMAIELIKLMRIQADGRNTHARAHDGYSFSLVGSGIT